MFNKDRKDFEEKWSDLRIFSEYGMLSDDKFAERAKDFHLMETTDGKFVTPEEFKEEVKATQTDKDGKTIFLYRSEERRVGKESRCGRESDDWKKKIERTSEGYT